MNQTRHPERLEAFIGALAELIESHPREGDLMHRGGKLLAQLIKFDDWLAPEFAQVPGVDAQPYLLHKDPQGQFSVVCVVRQPGQVAPIRDHRVWGLIGLLRGAEDVQGYSPEDDGTLKPKGFSVRLEPGQVKVVSQRAGDIHRFGNASATQISVSIQVYGADIGTAARATYALDGSQTPFVSGYANA